MIFRHLTKIILINLSLSIYIFQPLKTTYSFKKILTLLKNEKIIILIFNALLISSWCFADLISVEVTGLYDYSSEEFSLSRIIQTPEGILVAAIPNDPLTEPEVYNATEDNQDTSKSIYAKRFSTPINLDFPSIAITQINTISTGTILYDRTPDPSTGILTSNQSILLI